MRTRTQYKIFILLALIVANSVWASILYNFINEFNTYHNLTEIRQSTHAFHTAAMLGTYHPIDTERTAWLGQATMMHNLTLRQFEKLQPTLPPQTAAELLPLLQEYGAVITQLQSQNQDDVEILLIIFTRLDREWKLLIDTQYEAIQE